MQKCSRKQSKSEWQEYKMEAGTTYTEKHKPMCWYHLPEYLLDYGLNPPKTKWTIPQKIVENNKAMILWDFIQLDKQILANQDMMVTNKNQKSEINNRNQNQKSTLVI